LGAFAFARRRQIGGCRQACAVVVAVAIGIEAVVVAAVVGQKIVAETGQQPAVGAVAPLGDCWKKTGTKYIVN
jgi:hypothetical protein